MGVPLGAGERRGLAAWLVSNTSLTFDQIAVFTDVPGLDVRAIGDDEFSPRPLPVDPIRSGWLTREDIELAQADPNSALPRPCSWSESSLKPVSASTIADVAVEDAFLSRVAYMFYGRNAWHSTWIQRYYTKDSIALTVGSLKSICEHKRVQGSVFNIEELPCLVLRCADRTLFGVEINNNHWLKRGADVFTGPLFTKRILRRFASIPRDQVIWLSLPSKVTPKPVRFEGGFQRMTSYPQGSNRSLGWRGATDRKDFSSNDWEALLEAVQGSLALTNGIKRAAEHLGDDATSAPSDLEVTRTKPDGFAIRWRGAVHSFGPNGEPLSP